MTPSKIYEYIAQLLHEIELKGAKPISRLRDYKIGMCKYLRSNYPRYVYNDKYIINVFPHSCIQVVHEHKILFTINTNEHQYINKTLSFIDALTC